MGRITVAVPDAMVREMDRHSSSNDGMGRSLIVRQAITLYLSKKLRDEEEARAQRKARKKA